MTDALAILDGLEQKFAGQFALSHDSLNALQSARHQRQKNLSTVWHQIAEWVVAPVLAGFIGWMAEQRTDGALYLGVMREGRLLAHLMQEICDIPAQEIWLNRDLTMRAAFGCGDDEALVNWLTRTRLQPITKADAWQKLTGKIYDAKDGKQLLDAKTAPIFIDDLGTASELETARQHAAVLADRLIQYWQKMCSGLQNPHIMLMDFASAGNIQRSLQTVFKARNIPCQITGLNFAMTSGSRWAEEQGCAMRGFLSERGQPEWFASAIARTPELIEIFTAAPVGALKDFNQQGVPLYGETFLSPKQQNLIQDIQKHIIETAVFYHRALGKTLTADLTRCLWGRLLLQPQIEEVGALAAWPLDAGIDGKAQRVLATRLTEPEHWTKMQTAWPAASRIIAR